jgi:DNA-binding Lrp family transcriptional regulator
MQKVYFLNDYNVERKNYVKLLEEFQYYIDRFKLTTEEMLNLIDFLSDLEEGRFKWDFDEHYKVVIMFIVLKKTRPYTLDVFTNYRSRRRLIYCLKEIMKKLNITTKNWSKKMILEWFRKNGYIDRKEMHKISTSWVKKYNNEIKNFFATINKLEKEKRLVEKNWNEFTHLKNKS